MGDANEEDTGTDKTTRLDLSRVSFHSSESEPLAVSKETVSKFVSGTNGNYEALHQKVYLLDGFIAIYWLRGFALSGMTWADADDNSVDVPIESARSPKRKKKRRRSGPDE
jgi:hypothetical protein